MTAARETARPFPVPGSNRCGSAFGSLSTDATETCGPPICRTMSPYTLVEATTRTRPSALLVPHATPSRAVAAQTRTVLVTVRDDSDSRQRCRERLSSLRGDGV